MAKKLPVGVKGPKEKKPLPWRRWTLGLGALIVGGVLWWGAQPIIYSGSILFGICRTYIELNAIYPTTLQFIDLRERGPRVAVEWTHKDPFGQMIFNEGICRFKRGPNREILLDTFRLRRGLDDREYRFAIEGPEKIELFNVAIPTILQNPPPLYFIGQAKTLQDMKR